MRQLFTQLFFLFFFVAVGNHASAQWTQKTINHDNTDREYWIYVSPAYNSASPASIVVTLHGMGDNSTNFRGIGFNNIADTANIIVLVPESLVDGLTSMTAWNSQAGVDILGFNYYPNSDVDDIGFINAMIDEVNSNYSINQGKIYVCGFSMGGFMTQRLALQPNSKFASFASVAGTFGSGLQISPPGRPIPIAHFHGTSDATVGYDGNLFGSNVQELVDFWVDNNNCDPTAIHEDSPDLANDGLTVEHFLYPNGDEGTVVELFKVNNAEHIWLHPGVNDISYTLEIWKFFSRFEDQTLAVEENKLPTISVFPNPASQFIFVNTENSNSSKTIVLTDLNGSVVYKKDITGNSTMIPVDYLTSGIYILKVGEVTEKVIIK